MDELEKELAENYETGYKCGISWMMSWVPGGPSAYDERSKKIREEWLRGWRDGYKTQGKDFKKLPGYVRGIGASDSHGR